MAEIKGMYDKPGLIMLIIQGMALMYEVGLRAPKRYGDAMEIFNELSVECESKINECPDSPSKMATDFLEMIYSGAPVPIWMKYSRVNGYK